MPLRYQLVDREGNPVPPPSAIPTFDETATIEEIARTLRAELEPLYPDVDYCSLSPDVNYSKPAGRAHQPIGRYRWIACYAVTGGSEGHYVHVDRIWCEDYKPAQHEGLLLVKTFGGYAQACEIAAYIGARMGA